jgi:hypothetical protein
MKTRRPKDEMVIIRVTANEKKLLQFEASKLNTTVSELVRKFIIIK